MSRPGAGSAAATGLALCLLLGLTLAPAANAAFTGNGGAATSYSTASIPMPSAASFPASASCSKVSGLYNVSISITGTGNVQYANYYEMVVRNPAGAVQFTGNLSNPLERTYTTQVSVGAGKGNWIYEIRAKYKVPSTTNVWSGQPLARTLICN
ncbi:hypothetical protein [Arthrobacter sp. 4R501]|uniref:hypothetical protein n=1 Tax=Arthrobacter sp. 4R501 TaxID=2058886 RepID=UPI000CE37C58|nr:hypothetical protein [Arthrobacter sp. 4R501]